jgi:SAM-dependent methyltransferase
VDGLARQRKLKNAILRWRFPLKGVLARAYLRSSERSRAIRAGREKRSYVDGLAVPPAHLRVLVAGTAEIDWFLRSGKAQAGYLHELLDTVASPLDEMDAVLDFGCGCGRIARWFSHVTRPQINGCDYNRELVEWCDSNLNFMRVRKTELEPPLPFPDASFDFIYAFSVFTHLSVDLAARWMAELRRILRPSGFVWFTVHGEGFADRLLPEEHARFAAGEIIVRLPEIEGTNLCSAYWPPAAVDSMLGSGFETLVHLDPKADPVTAHDALLEHDAYLVRRL